MVLRFYTNTVSQASRNVAAGLFLLGLLLIGFGFLVFVLRDLFALLAAAVFVIAGAGCGITALKIYLFQRKIDRPNRSKPYRDNVRIRIEEHHMD